ncbi:MAG TPA: hypothetical protein VL651_02790, partial [Bacteroidia bacterium]|nr:hypothetical protein [Bacteroidia bacterium]
RAPVMSWQHFFLFAVTALAIPGIWFISLIAQGKGNLVIEFVLYQLRLFGTEDAGHGGSFFYHWIVLLVGCFPVSVFGIMALLRRANDTPFEIHFLKWMRILFWVVLILFSIVKTKIIHYSSLCWFPLTFLGTYAITKLVNGDLQWKKWLRFLFAAIALFFTAAFLLLPFIDHFKSQLISSGWITDPFAIANLEAKANWSGYEWMAGIVLLVTLGIFIFLFLKKKILPSFIALFTGMICTITLAAVLIVPHVEEYSQGAAIDYWQKHNCSDFYLSPLGYKSYAQYFYGNVQDHIANNPLYLAYKKENQKRLFLPELSQSENELRIRKEWILNGTIDYPAYFICKNSYKEDVKKYYPSLRYTGEKNGFVFWERVP